MDYFVIWPDGRRFGPADGHTLAQWEREGRINAETTLEEAGSGRPLKFSDLDPAELAWNEPAPLPPEPTPAEHEVMQAVASDKPVGATEFEVPQEFPLTSGSPYPVESYYVKGKSDLNTAWTLIASGFVVTFLTICCSMASIASLALTGTGIYYADKAQKAGEEGARTAKIVGIVSLLLQLLLLGGYVVFIAAMMMGMGGLRP